MNEKAWRPPPWSRITYVGQDRWVADCQFPECPYVYSMWTSDGDLLGAFERGVFASVAEHAGTHVGKTEQ